MVWTLVLLGPSQSPSHSPLADAVNAASGRAVSASGSERADVFAAMENRPILLPDPEDFARSGLAPGGSPPPPPVKAPALAAAGSDANPQSKTESPGDGAGTGSARTQTPDDTTPLSANSLSSEPAPQKNGGANGPTGSVGAGAPSAADHTAGDGPGSAGGTSAAKNRAAPPPWRSADWPTRVKQVNTTLDSGSVPASYRDLVRGYFSGVGFMDSPSPNAR